MDIKSWLHTVLQNYKDHDRTFRDVIAVLQMYISLKPKMDTYTYNNGDSQLLLCLHGTVPITYRSVPYNIPVVFWIPNEYPHLPPLAYVNPTASMVVRESKYVDKSGLCYHSYLSSWKEDIHKHTMLELIAILQHVFGQVPPVITKMPLATYSKVDDRPLSPSTSQRTSSPINPASIPQLCQSPVTFGPESLPWLPSGGMSVYNLGQGVANMSLDSSAIPKTSSGSIPSITAPSATPQPMGPNNEAGEKLLTKSMSFPSLGTSVSPTMTPSVPPRSNTSVENLQDSLRRKITDHQLKFDRTISGEIDTLLHVNRQLSDGENAIINEQRLMEATCQQLEANIQLLKSSTNEIEDVTAKVNALPDVAVDDAVCGTTVVYNQLFDLVSDDNAIQDTIYYLGKALSSERIDLATFMKSTRMLAREQFMKRALIKKILEAIQC